MAELDEDRVGRGGVDHDGDADLAPWRQLWLASELSEATAPAFAERVGQADPPSPSRFRYAAADVSLPRDRGPLPRLIEERRSVRDFGGGPLTARELGSLFSAFADPASPDVRRRAWPSAGGLYPLEIFALLLAVEGPLSGRAVHYEPDTHGLTDVGPSPSWADLREPLGAQALSGAPQVVVVFVLDADRQLAKYGNRGGRFALIEVGHAAQSLALQLATSGLAGCALGGTADRHVARILGLSGSGALVALGYACGRPPPDGDARAGIRGLFLRRTRGDATRAVRPPGADR